MQGLRRHLTYANVMSTIAAFVAVAGSTAYAADHLGRDSVGAAQLKPNSVTGAKVRKHSLRGADLKIETLPTVPSAKSAVTAHTADTAAHAETAHTAEHATVADSAGRAETIAAPVAPHAVGTPGQPGLEPAFTIATEEGEAVGPGGLPAGTPTFYIDREGIVHLQGVVVSTAPQRAPIFKLPPGYAPPVLQVFGGVSTEDLLDFVEVRPDGTVSGDTSQKEEVLSLDGITWRAG